MKDNIYASPLAEIADFSFDQNVAGVFNDMIRRSVPGYSTVIAMTGVLAESFAQENSVIYDLGCSLGTATLAMRHRVHAPNCRIIAVDNSPAMLDRARQNLESEDSPIETDLVCADIRDVDIKNASMVVMNFTLQFIPKEERDIIVKKICNGLRPGGAFILSEKFCLQDKQANELLIDLHHQFKKSNGYSDLEISQKRSALENVLVPETLDAHQARLKLCGFARSEVWFQCFNFASIVAVK